MIVDCSGSGTHLWVHEPPKPSLFRPWAAEIYLQRSMKELQFTVPFCPPVIVLLPAMTGFAELNQALI
jgi:hypothetical protein